MVYTTRNGTTDWNGTCTRGTGKIRYRTGSYELRNCCQGKSLCNKTDVKIQSRVEP